MSMTGVMSDQIQTLLAHIRNQDDEIARLKSQLVEASARVSNLNGLVIETYYPHSSRHRDEPPRKPPWASE